MENQKKSPLVMIDYTNYRGEKSLRTVRPKGVDFMECAWHGEKQWILIAWDFDRSEERFFAMKDVSNWRPYDPNEMTPLPIMAIIDENAKRML